MVHIIKVSNESQKYSIRLKSSNTQIKAKIQCSLGFLHWFARCVSGQHSVHVDLRLRHHGLHQHDHLREGEVWQREVRVSLHFDHLSIAAFQERGWGGEETKEADLLHLDEAEDAHLAAEQIPVQGGGRAAESPGSRRLGDQEPQEVMIFPVAGKLDHGMEFWLSSAAKVIKWDT